MAEDTKKNAPGNGAAEIDNENFQSVLRALLAAYQPVLKQELDLAANPAELSAEEHTSDHRPLSAPMNENR